MEYGENGGRILRNNYMKYIDKYTINIAFLKEIHLKKVEANELITAKTSRS